MENSLNGLKSGPQGRGEKFLSWATIVIVVLLAMIMNFTLINNDDDPWHLAAGKWMLANHEIATHDVFAYPYDSNPQRIWINIHWLFQVTIAILHSMGGWAMLTVMKSTLAGATALLFVLATRRFAPNWWIILCSAVMLHFINIRLKVRPEVFSFFFIALTIFIIETVRDKKTLKRLWLLPFIQLIWVNMHSLYVLGIIIMWSAWCCAWVDKFLARDVNPDNSDDRAGNPLASLAAAVPLLVASGACFISPMPIDIPMQAFMLQKDISGRSDFLTYGIAEFEPTLKSWSQNIDAIAIAVAVAFLFLARLLLEALRSTKTRVPARYIVWFAAFCYVACMARRNIALLGPTLGYLLAVNGGQLWIELKNARPILKKVYTGLTVVIVVCTLIVALLFIPRPDSTNPENIRFGAGRQMEKYPDAAAKFLGLLPAKGVLMCDDFGKASTFILYSSPEGWTKPPNRLVYMDGRVAMKVHTLDRFAEYLQLNTELRTESTARDAQIPDAIRFIAINYNNYHTLNALTSCPDRYRLLYIDPACVCYARLDWPGGDNSDLPAKSNISQYDKPLTDDGFVSGVEPAERKWYLPLPFSLNARMGKTFVEMGKETFSPPEYRRNMIKPWAILLAARYLTAAANENMPTRNKATAELAIAWQQMGNNEGIIPSTAVPLDILTATSLAICKKIDWEKLPEVDIYAMTSQQINTMIQARQLDSADMELQTAIDRLPPELRANAPLKYIEIKNRIKAAKNKILAENIEANFARKTLMQQVEILTSPGVGLTERAIAALSSASNPDDGVLMKLGDLHLSKGMYDDAMKCYERIRAKNWELELRMAMCDWVAGKYLQSTNRLRELCESSNQATAKYYYALLLEFLGDYDRAIAAVSQVKTDDAQLSKLIQNLRARMENRKLEISWKAANQ